MSVDPKRSYTVVIVGGGSGGIPVAARLARYLKIFRKGGTIAVIEPQNVSCILTFQRHLVIFFTL